MRNSRAAHEFCTTYSEVVPPRVGGGVGGGVEGMHASRPTSANRPVDNPHSPTPHSATPATPTAPTMHALRETGGGL